MTDTIIITLTPGDRLQLATTIERLINMLDVIDGDADHEPYLAGNHGTQDDREADYDAGPDYSGDSDQEADFADDEPTMGANECREGQSQVQWADNAAPDETEVENEHGGDLQDERHDGCDEGNDEPFMGWGERESQWRITLDLEAAEGQPQAIAEDNDTDAVDFRTLPCLDFGGEGYKKGKDQLRALKRRRPDRHQAHVRTSPALGWMT